MSRRRRLILLIGGSLVAVLAIGLVIYTRDEPLGDHSDLIPKPIDHEFPENGYFMFALACSKATDPECYYDRENYYWPRDGAEDSLSVLRSAVDKNSVACAHLRESVQLPGFVLSPAAKESRGSLDCD